jgi:site-specific recombinase
MKRKRKRTGISVLPRPDQLYRRLDELSAFAAERAQNEERVFWFVQLVRWLRGSGKEKRGLRLRYLLAHLEQYPDWRQSFSTGLTQLVKAWDLEQLLAYGGIARDFHLVGAVGEWLSFHVLPVACNTTDPVEVLALAFCETDTAWLSASEVGTLGRLLIDPDLRCELERSLDAALVDLGNQLVAQAHSPAVRSLSRLERSPFAGLTGAIAEFVSKSTRERRPEALSGRIRECLRSLDTHALELVGRGAKLNTTFQLDRMAQQLKRLELLVRVGCNTSAEQLGRTCIAIIRGITRHTSGRRLFTRSTDLLRQNLIDTEASVGHDYLAEDKSTWRAAFVAGAGGGALMAIATLIKYGLASLHLPEFYEGIAFSFNYATVFCAAYLMHFTIATKLPAHTAAALANSVQQQAEHRTRLDAFVKIWRAMVRLQLAGLLGNLATAIPVAYTLDRGYEQVLGHHVLDGPTAKHVLDANTLLGPSAIYAGVTGVFLWLSSIVGAVVDNWVRVMRLSDRLATNVRVMRGIGARWARPFANWWTARIGNLAGNAALGFMLGGIPAAFAIAHLPLEIRHVTVSASSWALAYAAGVGSASELALTGAGVVVIGVTNVSVSFALALQAALGSSARKGYGSARALVKIGIARWLRGTPRKRQRGAVHDRKLAPGQAPSATHPTKL